MPAHEEDLVDLLQQPLTALRLMVEGLDHGLVANSPELRGSLLACLAEMQRHLDGAALGPAARRRQPCKSRVTSTTSPS